MSISLIQYTDKERTALNHTVGEAIATYKRIRNSNGHPIQLNSKMVMTHLPADKKITMVQLNGLVEQALRPGLPSPAGFDLERLIAVTG